MTGHTPIYRDGDKLTKNCCRLWFNVVVRENSNYRNLPYRQQVTRHVHPFGCFYNRVKRRDIAILAIYAATGTAPINKQH